METVDNGMRVVRVVRAPYVQKGRKGHMLDMLGRLRKSDYEEVLAATGKDPDAMLRLSWKNSLYKWAICWDREVAAVFGLAPWSLTGASACGARHDEEQRIERRHQPGRGLGGAGQAEGCRGAPSPPRGVAAGGGRGGARRAFAGQMVRGIGAPLHEQSGLHGGALAPGRELPCRSPHRQPVAPETQDPPRRVRNLDSPPS